MNMKGKISPCLKKRRLSKKKQTKRLSKLKKISGSITKANAESGGILLKSSIEAFISNSSSMFLKNKSSTFFSLVDEENRCLKVIPEQANAESKELQTTKTVLSEKFDVSCVKRLYSPFHRFYKTNRLTPRSVKDNLNLMTNENPDRSSGLSPKERSFLICSCEAKTNRYSMLKKKVAEAQKKNKIFSIHGQCSAVRKALTSRGWIEKIPTAKMNLIKLRNGTITGKHAVNDEMERLLLSNLIERTNPDFMWFMDRSNRNEFTTNHNTIINRLNSEPTWTTKEGLCSATKYNYWHYIEDIAEVDSPRTYHSHDKDDHEDFIADFRLTACTSLLKWVISMIVNNKPILEETGAISINVLLFAISRCKEYLFSKQNKDIDKPIQEVSTRQWNIFLRKYYRLISKNDVFQSSGSNCLMYIVYAKFLLKEILRYRPQLRCEGCHNIWIIKPISLSRGRGIRMASNLTVISNLMVNKSNNKHVVQKYIEEPLLIHNTKFDIRQYYLVTSTQPLEIWMYKDCYLKFSSQRYDLKDYHESIHLTNNAVQKNYRNCENRHPDLPKNNMWDLNTFKKYLDIKNGNHVWDQIIYPTMKKNIVGVMISCQDSMMISKNRFELFGCDFLIDKKYRPWLIEINSCPDLNSTTTVTANICPAVIEDVIKVVIDRVKKSNACTGNFECVYRQTGTLVRYNVPNDLYVTGHALPKNYFYTGNLGNSDCEYLSLRKTQRKKIKQFSKTFKNNVKKQVSGKDVIVVDKESNACSSSVGTYTYNSESELSPTVSIVIGAENLTEDFNASPIMDSKSKLKMLSFDHINHPELNCSLSHSSKSLSQQSNKTFIT